MAGKGAVLASRILNEVAALGLVVGRVESAWKAAAANNDELYYLFKTSNCATHATHEPYSLKAAYGVRRHPIER